MTDDIEQNWKSEREGGKLKMGLTSSSVIPFKEEPAGK
jgi:hypothetical protein